MASRRFLVFDFGASNGRALIAEFDGKKINFKQIHRFDNRPVNAFGTLYWDILRLYSELKIGIQKAIKEYSNIAALGVDTWGVDFGFIDKNGKLLANPIHYRDFRRNNITEQVFDIIPSYELFMLSGAFILPIMSVFNMFALKTDGASELMNAHKFLMVPDIFNYFLTGEVINEFTEAATSVMFNQNDKKWEKNILKPLGIPEKLFTPPVMPGTRVGGIQPSVCLELGIPAIPVIAPATHDTSSAEAGIPLVHTGREWAFISIGTWGVCGMEVEKPIINMEVYESGYGNEGSADGGYFLACNITGLWIIQQCRENWMNNQARDISWEEIIEASLKAPRFKLLIDVDNPLFSQPQSNMPETIAEYCREKRLKEPANSGEMARAIYESLVMKFKYRLEQLERITKRKVEYIHLIGGGINNDQLCQWTSDATGLPCFAGPAEATAAGNLIMQLKGMGEINYLQEGREIIRNSLPVKEYIPKEKEMWEEAYSLFLNIL